MNTEARIRAIKALIEKGDKATEKAQQYYVSAGQHLKTLKGQSASAAAWEKLIKARLGLAKTRAYELLKIADGRTTVADVRLSGKARQAKSIAKLKSKVSVSDGETRALTVFTGGKEPDANADDPETSAAMDSVDSERLLEAVRAKAEQLAERLDADLSRALRALISFPDPRVVVHALRQALEQRLDGDALVAGVEERTPTPADDGLDIPPLLRRH
jgi:hypothetical protein